MRWPGDPVPQSSNSLQDFISSFERQIGDVYRHENCSTLELAGANITRSGNIVAHMKAPHTASRVLHAIQLGYHSEVTQASLDIPDFHCLTDILPEVELDVPWYGVVVHDVPAQPLLDTEILWDAVMEQTGLSGKDIRDLCVLCQDKDREKKERLSIRIMLEDSRLCDHLCHNKTFLFGMPCRVSRYRPRKKRHRPSLSS